MNSWARYSDSAVSSSTGEVWKLSIVPKVERISRQILRPGATGFRSALEFLELRVCCFGGNILVLVLATLRVWGTLPGSHWINGSFLVKLADASMRYLRFRFSALKYMS